MNNMDDPAQLPKPVPVVCNVITDMHGIFVKRTGLEPKLLFAERIWFDLVKAGYTAHDVDVFLQWVIFNNSQQEEKYQRLLTPRRLFANNDEFDGELQLARAWHRNRRLPLSAREQALQDLRPSVDPELEKARLNPARSAEEVSQEVIQKMINAEKERLRRDGIRTV